MKVEEIHTLLNTDPAEGIKKIMKAKNVPDVFLFGGILRIANQHIYQILKEDLQKIPEEILFDSESFLIEKHVYENKLVNAGLYLSEHKNLFNISSEKLISYIQNDFARSKLITIALVDGPGPRFETANKILF